MQRVCKYPLLLRELQKETPETDPTYPSIGKAMDDLQQYLSKINEILFLNLNFSSTV